MINVIREEINITEYQVNGVNILVCHTPTEFCHVYFEESESYLCIKKKNLNKLLICINDLAEKENK